MKNASATTAPPAEDLAEQLRVAEARSSEDAAQIKELQDRLETELRRANDAERKAVLAQQTYYGATPEKPETEIEQASRAVLAAASVLADAGLRQELADMLKRAQTSETELARLLRHRQQDEKTIRDLANERDALQNTLNRRY